MSGFLQRIAGSAIRRQTSLHPLMDSVYAVPRREEAPPRLLEETQRIVSQPPESMDASAGPHLLDHAPSASHTASVQPLAPNSPPIANARRERSDDAPTITSANSAAMPASQKSESSGADNPISNFVMDGAFQPLLRRFPAPQSPSGENSERPSEPTFSGSTAGNSPASAPSSSMGHSASDVNPSSRIWVYQPLIAAESLNQSQTEQAQRRSEPEQSGLILQAAAARRAAANEALAQRNAQPARAVIQPEDIQIHIGRIEVIAMPPPAARPAAAQVRRGQSLDEYLNGSSHNSSSGRSR